MLETRRNNNNWDLTWPEWQIDRVLNDVSNSRRQLADSLGNTVKLQGTFSWIRPAAYGRTQRLLLNDVLILIHEGLPNEQVLHYSHLNLFLPIEMTGLVESVGKTIYLTGQIFCYHRSFRAISHGSAPRAFGVRNIMTFESDVRMPTVENEVAAMTN